MKNTKFFFSLFVLLCFACVFSVFSQSQTPDAHLTGTLTDPSGATVSGARITAQPEGDAAAKPFTTDSAPDGTYSLALPPGRYHVVLTKDSFVTREARLTLQPGE